MTNGWDLSAYVSRCVHLCFSVCIHVHLCRSVCIHVHLCASVCLALMQVVGMYDMEGMYGSWVAVHDERCKSQLHARYRKVRSQISCPKSVYRWRCFVPANDWTLMLLPMLFSMLFFSHSCKLPSMFLHFTFATVQAHSSLLKLVHTFLLC